MFVTGCAVPTRTMLNVSGRAGNGTAWNEAAVAKYAI